MIIHVNAHDEHIHSEERFNSRCWPLAVVHITESQRNEWLLCAPKRNFTAWCRL